VKRGEIWWIRWESSETRPVVLLSADDASKVRAMHIVAPANADLSGIAVEVTVGAPEGLPYEGVVRVALASTGFIPCTWLITLAASDLVERAGALSAAKLHELEDALRRGGIE
jgi:mRNA interferase MazF